MVITVTVSSTLAAPLVSLCVNLLSHFRFHDDLSEHIDALPQKIEITLYSGLVDQVKKEHARISHLEYSFSACVISVLHAKGFQVADLLAPHSIYTTLRHVNLC